MRSLHVLVTLAGSSLAFVGVPLASADVAVGLTASNALVRFNTDSPLSVSAPLAVSGLQFGESLLGIDFRPATGELFGLGSTSRLYRLDMTTGVAQAVGSPFATALRGTVFGFDFNPVVDRARITSNERQNLAGNPITGGATVNVDLFYDPADPNAGAAPNIVASAYSNNVAGATSTMLYNIDASLNTLVRQTAPFGDGRLQTIGGLGAVSGGLVGIDIASSSGIAFATFDSELLDHSNLYQINLATGAATFLSAINAERLTDFAVTIPAPGALGLAAAGGILTLRRRRA